MSARAKIMASMVRLGSKSGVPGPRQQTACSSRDGAMGALTAIAVLGFVAACGPERPAELPTAPVASAQVVASAPGAAPTAAVPAPSGYSGHGAASVPPEVLAKFAPRPLPSDVTRRIQSMLDVRAPGGGAVSPDGKRLYFQWSVTGVRQLWRLDGPQRFPIQMTGGEDPATLASILPDGTTLVLARDRNGEENPGLYLQPVGGGPLAPIQHQPSVQTFFEFTTDDSRYVYFRANDKKKDAYAIYRYDRQTKQREVVFEQDGLWDAADWTNDGRLLLEKQVGGNMSEFFEYDDKTRALTPLFGQGEREDYEAAYGAQGDILVNTPKLGEFRRLYRFKNAKFVPITPDSKFDVIRFSIDRDKKRVIYETNESGYTRLRVLDAKTYAEVKVPGIPEGDHQRFVSTTRDGKFTTVSVETSKAPSRSFVIDWGRGAATEWHTPSAPEVDTSRFAVAKLEYYPARDGTKIPMFVRRPESCSGPCPVVVNFHGGPEGQARPGFHTTAQLFVDAGFILIEPNVRGSDGYGKTWIHADDGPKRLAVVTDIEDCAKYVRTAFAKDGKAPKVGILGGSYGGYSVLVGMTKFAGAYDAGVSVVGISNLVSFLENTAPYRRALRISEYGDPVKDREALVELSPITHINRVKAPLLIIQGATDPRVPVGEALQIHDALTARGVPTELMIFADEGHGAQKRGNQVLQVGHFLRFFERHLKGVAAPSP